MTLIIPDLGKWENFHPRVGNFTLNIQNEKGPGLEVTNNGQVNLIGTGALNVESKGNGDAEVLSVKLEKFHCYCHQCQSSR